MVQAIFILPFHRFDFQLFEKTKLKRRFSKIKRRFARTTRRFIFAKRRFGQSKRKASFFMLVFAVLRKSLTFAIFVER